MHLPNLLPLSLDGKVGEANKPEDLQDESIAHIVFEEERGSLFYFNIIIMRVIRICTLLAGFVVALLPVCELFSQTDSSVHLLDSLLVIEKRNNGGAVDSSVPLQKLRRSDLDNLGVTNAGDALKHMSGVTVKDYGGVGGLKSVAIRGMGAQHTAVFYDGVAIGDCQSGQVDLGRFSTENLEEVQLTIGQSDDIYQSARVFASAGAVSLETRSTVEQYLRATARAGSYNTYQANMQLGHSLGQRWHMSLFGDYVNTKGDYDFNIKGVGGKRNNSDVETVRGEMNVAWNGADKHSLRAKLYVYYSSRGVPGSVIVDNPFSSEKLVSRNLFGQLLYEYIPSSVLKMKVAFKHNYSGDRNRQPSGVSGNHITHKYNQHETDLSYTMKWSPEMLNGLSFAFSEELFHNILETDNRHLVMSSNPRRLTALSAVSARYLCDWLGVTASLLYTNATEWAKKGYSAPNRSRLSPALSLSFYPFGDNFCLRASYKDIFRLPTFNDLYYRETGNYKLNPEKSRMFNLGTAYSHNSQGWLNNFELSADAYYGKVEDKIVAVPGVFIWKMSNVDDVKMAGLDVNLSSAIRLSAKESLKLTTTYSYMYAVNDTEGSVIKGDQIVYTPRNSGSASLVFDSRLCSAGYSLVWSGERYSLAQNIPSNRINSYFDHSLWLACNWNLAGSSLTAKIEALNITDNNYEVIRYYPMPGRNYRLSLTLEI